MFQIDTSLIEAIGITFSTFILIMAFAWFYEDSKYENYCKCGHGEIYHDYETVGLLTPKIELLGCKICNSRFCEKYTHAGQRKRV